MDQGNPLVEETASAVSSLSEEVVRVEGLWKVYGRESKRITSDKYSQMSKDDIRKKTGNIVGLKDVSFSISKGEFFIIMGLSGSGKSTLIRNLIRLIRPTTGRITINGVNITKLSENDLLEFRKKTFGMVFQNYGLLPHLTVLDNAAYGLKVRGLPKGKQYAKAMRFLETVGLSGWEDYYPNELSGGMQQRVGLARALANDPEILLMDEPFSGLDPLIRRQMQDEFIEIQDKLNKTIIFVTHDLSEALKLGDRIAILHDGEIAQIGTPEEIVTVPADSYVQEFVQDASPAKVVTAGSIMVEPEVLLYSWEGPRTALSILKNARRSGAFVVDKNGILLGVTNINRLERIIENPVESQTKRIDASAITKIPSVSEDTILEDLFGIVSANPYPIPVIGENRRLVGVVRTDDIFETISPNRGDQND